MKYQALDFVLISALSPGTHKKNNPVINRDANAPASDWPKISPMSDFLLAVIFAADDYVNGVADADRIDLIVNDITELAQQAKTEATAHIRKSRRAKTAEPAEYTIAKTLIAAIDGYVRENLAPSQKLIDHIHAIQKNAPPEVILDSIRPVPRTLPAQRSATPRSNVDVA